MLDQASRGLAFGAATGVPAAGLRVLVAAGACEACMAGVAESADFGVVGFRVPTPGTDPPISNERSAVPPREAPRLAANPPADCPTILLSNEDGPSVVERPGSPLEPRMGVPPIDWWDARGKGGRGGVEVRVMVVGVSNGVCAQGCTPRAVESAVPKNTKYNRVQK